MPSKPSGTSTNQPRTAFQRFKEQLRYIDFVIEVLDGRGPLSSRHPQSAEIFGDKPRVLVITKEDLGDPTLIKDWTKQFNAEGKVNLALALNLKSERNKEKIFKLALDLTQQRREQHAAKGLLPRPMRVCVVGMPNVGKSSLINWLIGRKKTKVGNRPGITRGAQWVRIHPQIELLDTPGVLPAFSFSEEVAYKLALLNLLPEANYDVEEIAARGLSQLKSQYPELLKPYISTDAAEISLHEIARVRNFLTAGGKLDTVRAANIFLSDLRHGKLGRFTLDRP